MARAPRHLRGLILILTALLPAAAAGADVSGVQVKRAIRRGVAAVRAAQQNDGTWPERNYPGGQTCLSTLALLNAGEPPDSPTIQAALPRIAALDDRHTYVVSLKIMALAAADPDRYRPQIFRAARWLVDAQNDTGLWNYTPGGDRFDHSNAQFALLGLYEAAKVGARIPRGTWFRARRKILETQHADGGWSYQAAGESYGSMTAAGVAGLFILGDRLHEAGSRSFPRTRQPCCGDYALNAPLARGLQWLATNFSPDRNPPRNNAYIYYWLYAVERCGILSGQRYFGRHDWYREGAAFLIDAQRADGIWNGSLSDTCFALLFLAKGHKSLLVQKLQWSDDDDWTPVHYELDNLVAFLGDELGQPVAWQVVPFDTPLDQWLAAPLLYIQGRTFPKWNAAQRAKVREYVEQGGTLMAEATCGDEGFNKGFIEFIAATFPEVPLRELEPEHPIYHLLHDIEPYSTADELAPYAMQGVDFGCRTAIFYSPRDLACSWAVGDIPYFSERNLQLGANLAAYAVGRRPLIDRLAVVVMPEADETSSEPPPGAGLRLAQIVYSGDWRPFPLALVQLADFLREQVGFAVIPQYRQVRLTDEQLFASPLLWLSGHYDFDFSAAERDALAAHLRRGGFLVAEATCGTQPFDAAFRRLVRQMFSDATLQKLPSDHPIFTGNPGFDVTTVAFSPDVQRAEPDRTTPELWGLTIEGRLVLVYSPYSLSCGLAGSAFDGCWGYASPDARRLAANIVLYALTH